MVMLLWHTVGTRSPAPRGSPSVPPPSAAPAWGAALRAAYGQCAVSVWKVPPAVRSEPTAQKVPASSVVTALRLRDRAPRGAGLATRCHALPSHCSNVASPTPLPL